MHRFYIQPITIGGTTLPKIAYEHAHLPGAINLPPDQITDLAPARVKADNSSSSLVSCSR